MITDKHYLATVSSFSVNLRHNLPYFTDIHDTDTKNTQNQNNNLWFTTVQSLNPQIRTSAVEKATVYRHMAVILSRYSGQVGIIVLNTYAMRFLALIFWAELLNIRYKNPCHIYVNCLTYSHSNTA